MKTRGAYAYLLGARVTGALGGLATAEMIARRLDAEGQGFYYAFLSTLGLQLVMEMGLTSLLVVRTSHHASRLEWDGHHLRSAVPPDLAVMFRWAMVWYLVLAALTGIGCAVAGPWLFGVDAPRWTGPWWFACCVTAIQLLTQPLVATLEGSGKVSGGARVRFLQSLGVQLGACAALAAGCGLYAVGVSTAVMFVFTLVGLGPWWHLFVALLKGSGEGSTFRWRRQIWPAQWRLGFVGVTVFSIASLPTLLILRFCSEVEAGQWGMARRLFETILFAGSAMFTTRTAVFGSAFAQGRLSQMISQWRSVMVKAVGLVALGSMGVPLGLRVLTWIGFHFPERMGETPLHVVLGILTVVNCFNWGVEVFVRSAGTEPYLWQSITRILVTASALFWVIPGHGTFGAACCLLAIAGSMVLPWNHLIMRETIRRWRSTHPTS